MTDGDKHDTAEAARHLGVTEGHLANLRSQRKGPTYLRHRGRIYYSTEALNRWEVQR